VSVTKIIRSRQNKFVKQILKKHYRGEIVLCESFPLIKDLVESIPSKIKGLFIKEDFYNRRELDLGVSIEYWIVNESVMKKLATTSSTPPILAVLLPPDKYSYRDKIFNELVIFLYKITDPGNLGCIIRSAYGAGVETVCFSKGSVSVNNSKLLRAARGMNYFIELIEVENEKNFLLD